MLDFKDFRVFASYKQNEVKPTPSLIYPFGVYIWNK